MQLQEPEYLFVPALITSLRFPYHLLPMNHWLDTFLTEKQVDQEVTFIFQVEGLTHYVPFEVVREFVEHLPEADQQKVKEKLIQIDFMDGNVLLFLEYLAKGMVTLT